MNAKNFGGAEGSRAPLDLPLLYTLHTKV